MEEQIPNWRKDPSMLRFYQQVQTAEGGLEPDPAYLSDVSLGRYATHQIKDLEMPDHLRHFLMDVGLPDAFAEWRSPDEEAERRVTAGGIFWISSLRIQEIKRKKYLVIGESRELGRSGHIKGHGTPQEVCIWNKTESAYYIVVEMKKGTVWKWESFYDEDILTYINSSPEQYLLSMAYWRAFYPEFAAKVRAYTEKHPDRTDLDYIFRNRKTLYEPFRKCLRALDPEAAKKRSGYWQFMCDLSLY